MRLLIITQKIDEQDAVLGFMHGWVAEFARQAEGVLVICLEKGQVNLPENVGVFSLGKEKTELRIRNYELWKKIKYAWRFIRYIATFRKQYDTVFVHMNPEYIMLGGFFWKLWGKTVTLWYAHKSVPWHLRVAYIFTDIIFTSTASGFRLSSKKVKVIGQGIDTNKFKVKSLKLKVEETIIGPTSIASDEVYLKRLKEKVVQKGLADIISFHGAVANTDLPVALSEYDLFVNMGHTGSLDKAVPEAMACGLPVLTCNEAFKEVLGAFTADLMYPKGDAEALAGKIKMVIGLSIDECRTLREALRAIVVRDHSLQSFVRKIISAIESFSKP